MSEHYAQQTEAPALSNKTVREKREEKMSDNSGKGKESKS